MSLKIGLFNDSFPPTIDGVANTVLNYAEILHKNHGDVTVATPKYPHVKDDYPFEVYRYSSVPVIGPFTYRIGNPVSPIIISELRARKLDLVHIHSPFVSSLLARAVTAGRKKNRIPVILTYHTKYDVDIAKFVHNKRIQKAIIKFLLFNIKHADEVWTVSEGAGESLRKIGYKGEYKVMFNGTDFEKGKADDTVIDEIKRVYALKGDELVFLFVGRMMWYKNIKLIIDTLKILDEKGLKFRALFVGDGNDRPAIEHYANEQGLESKAIFAGAIYNREKMRGYYSIADLFLFPSTYDTSGLVVKEAAACSCASLLIDGSCAAEGVVHDETGLLCEETPEACAQTVYDAATAEGKLKQLGKNASKQVYVSWEDAIAKAYSRYEEILKTWPYRR